MRVIAPGPALQIFAWKFKAFRVVSITPFVCAHFDIRSFTWTFLVVTARTIASFSAGQYNVASGSYKE